MVDPSRMNIVIKSPANERVKFARKLHKRSERDRSGLFIIEGHREIKLAIEAGVKILQLFFHPDGIKENATKEIARGAQKDGALLLPVSKRVMEKISYRETSSVFVAIASQPEFSLDRLPSPHSPLFIVADSIEKPGNIGAIVRTADACGVNGVIITPEKADPLNPNAIRASLGTIFTVSLAVSSVSDAIKFLKESKVQIIVATPDADKLYTEVDMKVGTAIIVGSEDLGVGEEWLDAADELVRIPMLGRCDSLNVSVSAAIILYEALRQRNARQKRAN